MNTRIIILNFLYKFFCILKAASKGYIVTYIGGNKFLFKHNKNSNLNRIINNYTKTLPSFLSNK